MIEIHASDLQELCIRIPQECWKVNGKNTLCVRARVGVRYVDFHKYILYNTSTVS